MDPLLLFHNHLHIAKGLIEGRLLLLDKQENIIVSKYTASSGMPGWQEADDICVANKGSIPEQNKVDILYYLVGTEPIYHPIETGIEGFFFTIIPRTVTIKNVERGNLSICQNVGSPGTSGEIAIMNKSGWISFQQQIKKLNEDGMQYIPLLVSYS